MNKLILKAALSASIVVGVVTSCSSDDNSNEKTIITKNAVVENYAAIVHASYKDSYDKAVVMQTAITAFTASPTDATLTAAKKAWKEAREPYGQTEAYRESNGPIDTAAPASANGLDIEDQLNAWPLDEAFIDYVTDASAAYAGENTGGFVANATFNITKASLIEQFGSGGGDKNVSTGWHAIEFLLWGQDETLPSLAIPGQRPVTDYTTDANKDRRIKYLQTATALLVDDLKSLVDTWAQGGSYRTEFLALDTDVALTNAIKGSFFIAGEELSTERMQVAVDDTNGIDGSGQELEHSCFSDNTHRDVYANAYGVINVVFGKYNTVSGASFYDLVKQKDAAQAEILKKAIDDMKVAINAIDASAKGGKYFDQMIVDETTANPGLVMAGVTALKKVANEISASASKIGLNLN